MNIPKIVEARPGSAAADSQISVGWLTNAPEVAGGLLYALQASPDLNVLGEQERHRCDVVLAIADTVDDDFIDALVAAFEATTNPAQRIVLVSGPLQRRHLPRLFRAGVVGMLAHHEAGPRRIARAIYACHNGQSMISAQLTRWLLDEIRFVQQDLLASQNLAPGGLTTREVEVLKYIAQGHETAEVAAKLSYSERTIKKILQDVLVRLHLHNRAHAVSYAMRVGAI
ncbi:DNA-binding response regulator, NarL/FixJ family, contains REC and HTH domains [Lentzea waywayandensis]|uniref:DNA-binding response regulator, NarL/FixJ family, contains REC and HTH domains n=1 Tax=Lentzea waywayandensis TaxID=84724 RepID=A0A1I6FJB0_9PSEU|nr:response regulator transcription factor [Lentzea waywayandensis]SFR29897.1 DNA-binding response regulator, NarL/FixJ family, contains REC and HTH domains [Lentzea waywayandensis]